MKYKTFKYKNYKNCYFEVGNYPHNLAAMWIVMKNDKWEDEKVVTVNVSDFIYQENLAAIKNYSENSGMTNFLIDLDIIDYIYSKKKIHPYASKSEIIDLCEINIEELKKYCKKFDYEWKF